MGNNMKRRKFLGACSAIPASIATVGVIKADTAPQNDKAYYATDNIEGGVREVSTQKTTTCVNCGSFRNIRNDNSSGEYVNRCYDCGTIFSVTFANQDFHWGDPIQPS